MTEEPTKAYGEGRTRAGVSHAQVERTAIAILKSERRPTVETVRAALGTGSPDTIAIALKRFWRDLGARIEGDPAALTRMPPDIADLADGMWQRALKLAAETAKQDNNAARERFSEIKAENDIRAQSLTLREREWDTAARERERALADARDHLLSLSKALSREQATNQAHEVRIAALETEVAQYREQFAALIAGATGENLPRQRRRASPLAETPPAVRASRPLQRPARTREKAARHTAAATEPSTSRRPPRTPSRKKPNGKRR